MTAQKKRIRERGGATCPCPQCDQATRILDTRRKGSKVLRRRSCLSCYHTFKTEEEVVLAEGNGSC